MLIDRLSMGIVTSFGKLTKTNKQKVMDIFSDEEFGNALNLCTLELIPTQINLIADFIDDDDISLFDTVANMNAFYRIKQYRIINLLSDLVLGEIKITSTLDPSFDNTSADQSFCIIQFMSAVLEGIIEYTDLSCLSRGINPGDILVNILNDIDPATFDKLSNMVKSKVGIINSIAVCKDSTMMTMGYILRDLVHQPIGNITITIETVDNAVEYISKIVQGICSVSGTETQKQEQ